MLKLLDQSGFLSGHRTSVLLRVTEEIRRGINDGKVTVIVLFELSSESLTTCVINVCYGFSRPAVKLMRSYPNGRENFTEN